MIANLPTDYPRLLEDIKERIRTAQVRANLSVNRELILLYWGIGQLIFERQQREGWGAGVLRRLSNDLRNELPDVKGFSERNIKLMTQFYREYPALFSIGQPPVAQLPEQSETGAKEPMAVAQDQTYGKTLAKVQQLVTQLPWAHNILLIQKTAGKINFYCNVVDDLLKHETDNPTIGLILCQDKKKVLA
ncbi:MAG: DUF1016 family protein, partial [Desulfobacterales bacterium]|nr:DUF1016 family protein [Desulfobacterales bacterium]